MAASVRRSWAHSALAKGRSGAAMTEEDSESVHTDSQTGEDTELPVIQLCGLVEELRYPTRCCRPLLRTVDTLPEWPRTLVQPGDHPSPH